MFQDNPAKVFQYLVSGAKLLLHPGLKRFVIIPLLINLVVFILLTTWAVNTFSDYYSSAVEQNDWLAWLILLFWLFAGLIALLVYGYTFNLLTTLIAAPFYGFLAEKIEQRVTGNSAPAEPLASLIVRTFKRELVKLWYFISRGVLIFIAIIALFFIPLIGSFGGLLISSLWSAWCMTVQYTDYSADNHQVAFKDMRARLRQKPLSSFSLGGLIILGSIVPVLNIFMMPVAVAASTLYWLDHHQKGAATTPSIL